MKNVLYPRWPLSSARWASLIVTALCGTAFALGYLFYGELPDRMASHWGIDGTADGYMDKPWGTFLLPSLMVVLSALLFAVPRMDPRKANLEGWRGYYDAFIVLFTAFFLYLHVLVLIYNLGWMIDVGSWLMPSFAVLWFYIGILLGHARKNWFVGIRTPWTLTDEDNWTATHRLATATFKSAGILLLLGVFLPSAVLWYAALPILLASALIPVVYSYVLYRRNRTT